MRFANTRSLGYPQSVSLAANFVSSLEDFLGAPRHCSGDAVGLSWLCLVGHCPEMAAPGSKGAKHAETIGLALSLAPNLDQCCGMAISTGGALLYSYHANHASAHSGRQLLIRRAANRVRNMYIDSVFHSFFVPAVFLLVLRPSLNQILSLVSTALGQ